MLDKLNSISDAIDAMDISIKDDSLTEAQRAGMFLDYKEYLDQAATRMEQAKTSSDSVLKAKAEEISQKITAILEQAGTYMVLEIPQMSKEFEVAPVEVARTTAANEPKPEAGKETYLLIGSNGFHHLHEGPPSGLNACVNLILADDIAAGHEPIVYRCERLEALKTSYFSFVGK